MPPSWLDSIPTQNAVVVRVTSTLVDRLRTAYASATTVQILRAIAGDTGRPDTDADSVGTVEGGQSDESIDDSEVATADSTAVDTTDGAPEMNSRSRTVPTQTSMIYRMAGAIRTRVQSAWLYRWLTSEPDPDVIVIDLRETRVVGPVLSVIEAVITRGRPAASTSRLTGMVIRLRRRGRARPIRTVSLVVAGAAVVLILMLLLTGSGTGVSTLTLLGVLILALRGTQNTQSVESISETRWFNLLAQAFTPPEPPTQSDRDDNEES